MILLAHHVELQHLPVLAVFLAAGVLLGWGAISRLLTWMRSSAAAPDDKRHVS